MKQLFKLALPLVALSGLASAAVTPQCNSGVFTTQYTVSTITSTAGGFTCQIGDKIFSAFSFSGTANANDTVQFSTGSFTSNTGSYIINYGAGAGQLTGTLGFNFTVTIDPTASGFIPSGKQASFTQVTAGIQDSTANSSGTLTKNIGTNGVQGTCTATANETVASNGNQTQNTTACNLSPSPAVQTLTVAETLVAPAAGVSGVTGFQDTFVQTFTATFATPEPVSMLLFGSGLIALAAFGRKRIAK